MMRNSIKALSGLPAKNINGKRENTSPQRKKKAEKEIPAGSFLL